ncbi:hypothetical protein [Bosea sp. (in: a-proteobacteria)]|uniref:ribonuclease toxin HepT-like protein n=1 Tax=Bosea sp. (in: a-proteobacteria) TaxID=1871050 RepID=UPI002FC6517B
MMAERWSDIKADIAAAKRHFAAAVRISEQATFDLDNESHYDAAMALQHAMLAGYTSFELGLRRILALLGEDPPIGPDWHAALVRRVATPIENGRPAIISLSLSRDIGELMRFRQVAMHSYDDFDFERAKAAVAAATRFVAGIEGEIAAFRAVIDPD